MQKQIIVSANGAEIPAIGLGTWQLRGEEGAHLVEGAIRAGYRHVDTASMYENEEAVGQGIRASGIKREDIFVTTKVPPALIGEDLLLGEAEASLKRLGLNQVDLLLIHWPNPAFDLAGTMRALSAAKRKGLAKHIGISNFPINLLDQAVALASEPLVVNQCENHPLIDQKRLIAATHRHGMAFTSYTPLVRGKLLGHPVISAIAKAHGRTDNQIVLRWHVQQSNIIAIPRSSNASRIAENLDVFDFALSDLEMAAITGLAQPDGRVVNPAFAPVWDTLG